MSVDIQLQIKRNAEEQKEMFRDLNSWVEEMEAKDKALKQTTPTELSHLPPIRQKSNDGSKAKQPTIQDVTNTTSPQEKPAKRIVPRSRQEWDKLDIEALEKEIDNEEAKNDSIRQRIEAQQRNAKIQAQKPQSQTQPKQQQKTQSKPLGKNGSFVEELSPEEEAEYSANDAKEKGNNAFRSGKYQQALDFYSRGLSFQPSNSILLCNKAAALNKLNRNQEAEQACTKALSIDPAYVKCWVRRANVRKCLGKFSQAMDDLKKALTLEPGNASIRKDIEETQKAIDDTLGGVPLTITETKKLPIGEVESSPAKPAPKIELVAQPTSAQTPAAPNTETAAKPTRKLQIEEVEEGETEKKEEPKQTPKKAEEAPKLVFTPSLPSAPIENWVDFDRHFRQLKSFPSLLSEMMFAVPLESFRAIFASSLEYEHVKAFVTMMGTADSQFAQPENVSHAIQFWKTLSSLPGWNIAHMCLTKQEKGELHALYDKLLSLDPQAEQLKKPFKIK
ncbi:putative RNA polymerase II-associated protein 3 [Blattamonas nauphoetae]|uniref:RNA polymerase II-associated protein 3 n=1 Tax=Blattamonas nauphoetae TaxID=2049346 RepID=A0ABQ9XP34_9EUKA|nr:putative RNA polymerase II-associated protein 3 [Blattamonas nauphoetae]